MGVLKPFGPWLGSAALFAAACGGGSGKTASPTAPSAPAAAATTSTIEVNLTAVIKAGETAQASATASLSNGQSQAVTTGWTSDALGVATVTDGGLVSGISNGQATISVVSGNTRGQRVIRVVPEFQGQWSGGLLVTSCTQSGFWADTGFCDDFKTGETYAYSLGVTQTGEALSVQPSFGADFAFPTGTAAIDPNGRVEFSSTWISPAESRLSVQSTWRLTSPSRGAIAGTVSEVWRASGFPGEGRLEQDIVRTGRTAAATAGPLGRLKPRPLGERLRR